MGTGARVPRLPTIKCFFSAHDQKIALETTNIHFRPIHRCLTENGQNVLYYIRKSPDKTYSIIGQNAPSHPLKCGLPALINVCKRTHQYKLNAVQ